ncbi:MAG: FHA domain-containing protein [Myxococcales bacterium]|nr:FHA domain-containing protein [Myxococcales bacterium]
MRGMRVARFPPGEIVLAGRPFGESLFSEVDRLLAQGYCPEGRLEIETEEKRLTCLVHRSLPHLGGLQEEDVFSPVWLKDFPVRARQMLGAVCTLQRTDPVQVLLAAIHFRSRPEVQATTELLDLAHVLSVLEREGQDAALALERAGARTLLFLQKGKPARVYFADPATAPAQGAVTDRFLAHVYDPAAPPGRVEVWKSLNIAPDPDAGTSLSLLAEAARPPPPATVLVRLGGRVVLQRPFMPPAMTVGRDPVCEIPLDNLSVSRRHARICWEKGRFVVEDLGSANGTTRNGEPVQRAPLDKNDRVGVGKFELSLAEAADTVSPDATMHLMPRAAGEVRLVGDGVSIPLARQLSIGRSASADVQARGWRVRPFHALILEEGPGVFRLRCTGGPVQLNGRRVKESLLRPRDVLVVGRSRFTVQAAFDGEDTQG